MLSKHSRNICWNTLSQKSTNSEFFSSPYFLVPELNTEVYRLNLLIQFELVFSSPNLPVFGLNTEIYSINLFIQSK